MGFIYLKILRIRVEYFEWREASMYEEIKDLEGSFMSASGRDDLTMFEKDLEEVKLKLEKLRLELKNLSSA